MHGGFLEIGISNVTLSETCFKEDGPAFGEVRAVIIGTAACTAVVTLRRSNNQLMG